MSLTGARIALASIALTALVSLPAAPSNAATSERINAYTVAMTVQKNGVLQVTETIDYDFGSQARRGIFRDIPLGTQDQPVRSVSVTRNGAKEPTAFENTGDWLRVRIGNPDRTITGVHRYVITYTAAHALAAPQDKPGVIALSWDAIGDGWEVPIQRAVVTVNSKRDLKFITCVTGPPEAANKCTRVKAGTYQVSPLPPGHGVTIYAPFASTKGLPKPSDLSPADDFIDLPWGEPTTLPSAPSAPAAPQQSPTPLLLLPFGVLLGIAAGFLARARTPRGAIQFEPPRATTPLQLGACLSGGTAMAAPTLAGTLLDLAQRGWISVSLADDEPDPRVTWLGHGRTPLTPEEEQVVQAALNGQPSVTITAHSLQPHVRLLSQAQQNARDAVPLAPHPSPNQRRWQWAAVAVGLLGIGVLLAISTRNAYVSLPLAGAGLGMLTVTGWVGRLRSDDETAFLQEADGFRRLLGTDAAQRRIELVERYGYSPGQLAATLLPYAVVLGVESQWLAAFPDIPAEQLASYTGVSGAPLTDRRLMRRLRHVTAASLTPRPSPARPNTWTGVRSGPGFSGGRGFSGTRRFSTRSSGMRRSGGGRGGGGGGSW